MYVHRRLHNLYFLNKPAVLSFIRHQNLLGILPGKHSTIKTTVKLVKIVNHIFFNLFNNFLYIFFILIVYFIFPDALQQGASQFESSAGRLKRKMWWKNIKVKLFLLIIMSIPPNTVIRSVFINMYTKVLTLLTCASTTLLSVTGRNFSFLKVKVYD